MRLFSMIFPLFWGVWACVLIVPYCILLFEQCNHDYRFLLCLRAREFSTLTSIVLCGVVVSAKQRNVFRYWVCFVSNFFWGLMYSGLNVERVWSAYISEDLFWNWRMLGVFIFENAYPTTTTFTSSTLLTRFWRQRQRRRLSF